MGQNVKTLRTRIKSVDSTLHLTKAMGLVASSKVRKALDNMQKSRQYSKALKDTLTQLSASQECKNSEYFNSNSSSKTKVIVIAGDRGMAGGYNANVFRQMQEFTDFDVIAIGKRACDRFAQAFVSSEKFSSEDAWKLSKELCEDYKANKFNKLVVVSTKYESAMSQVPQVTQLMPIEASNNANLTTIFEPNEKIILEKLIPEYISGSLIALIRESFACEVTARRTAMDSAGKNATEMIDRLTLEYNRARQGAITQEITEIVAGSGN